MAPAGRVSTCRSCGAEIVWALTGEGRRIPLNAEPERRFIITTTDNPERVQTARSVPTYVSHFATCPQANEWRRE